MPNNIDNDSEQNKWSQRWKKYNPFSVANVWNGVQTIGKTTVGALKRLWNTDEEESCNEPDEEEIGSDIDENSNVEDETI